jgi:hypothetical protein
MDWTLPTKNLVLNGLECSNLVQVLKMEQNVAYHTDGVDVTNQESRSQRSRMLNFGAGSENGSECRISHGWSGHYQPRVSFSTVYNAQFWCRLRMEQNVVDHTDGVESLTTERTFVQRPKDQHLGGVPCQVHAIIEKGKSNHMFQVQYSRTSISGRE